MPVVLQHPVHYLHCLYNLHYLHYLSTISTLSTPCQGDGPFINLARLNIGKYSGQAGVAKPLFEYIFYHENSVREAMDLAAQALQATK